MFLIAISIFLLFILFPDEIFLYSDTILGKFMAVIIIIYSTYESVIYGLFVCIMIIWFYQSDILDRFRYRYRYSENFTALPNLNPQAVYIPNHPHKDIESIPTLDALSLDKVYPDELPPLKKESEQIFRNQHCSEDLELMYKDTKIIHKENISQLFPEVTFFNEYICNPCDTRCRFRVKKINEENELMPKHSRGNNNFILEWAKTWFIEKTEPFQGIGYVASFL